MPKAHAVIQTSPKEGKMYFIYNLGAQRHQEKRQSKQEQNAIKYPNEISPMKLVNIIR